MKVSMVTTDFLPNIGGVTQHIVEIGKALLARGHRVEIITVGLDRNWGGYLKKPWPETISGLDVWRIPFVLDRSVVFVSGQITFRISDGCFRRGLLKRLRSTNPDLVHWHAVDSRLNPMKEWTSSARVWTNHTSMFLDRFDLPGERKKLFEEASQADEVIAPSGELQDLTIRLGIPKERVHFVPNGVDQDRFSPRTKTAAWSSRLGVREGQPLVLCPRRLAKKNGVSYFVKAAIRMIRAGIQNVKFVIAGDHEGNVSECEASYISQLIEEAGVGGHIVLLGRVENIDLPGLYALSHVVVIPSLQEATSLSAMEAMACGKPVVASDVGGLPFLVHHEENGLLVPPKNEEVLSAAIGKLLQDPALALRMGGAGRLRVERELDWSHIAEKTEDIYQKAVRRFMSRGDVRFTWKPK